MKMDEIYGLKLNSQFIDKLNNDTKVWIAKAMINCIISDKGIEKSEIHYLDDALSLINDDKQRKNLLNHAINRKQIELNNLIPDQNYHGHIFFYLAMLIASDVKVKVSEFKYLQYISCKLGFKKDSAKIVMDWAYKSVQLKKRRDKTIKTIKNYKPFYSKQNFKLIK